MSVHVTSWVLKHSPVGGNDRLVLLSLADKAEADGTDAYPSLATIAHEARCSTDTARRALRRLQSEGHIVPIGMGPRGTNRWAIVMGGSKLQGVAPGTQGGGIAVPPEPSIEPPTMSVRAPARESHRFNGKAVEHSLGLDAEHALAHYTQRTGQAVQPRDGRGNTSESMKRIIGAMEKHPALRTTYRRVIDVVLNAPWWEGPPSVGVIFGPAVIEQNIARASAPLRVVGQSRRRNGRPAMARPSDFDHLFAPVEGDSA